MKSLLVALALLLMWVGTANSKNVFVGTNGIASIQPSGCPFPTGALDGCLAAPAPLTAEFFQQNGFQPGDYINTTAATSSNYMATNCGLSANQPCRPQWNVAGFDYAIGNYTPALSTCTDTGWVPGHCLLDPAMIGSGITVAGCTYSTSASGTTAGLLTCGNTGFTGTLAHYNFGPLNSHGCTALRLNGTSTTSTDTLDDLYFFNDTGLCDVNVSNGSFSILTPLLSKNVVLTNIFMDGNARTWPDTQGGCATLLCNPGSAWVIDTTGTFSAQYVAVVNYAGRALNMPAVASSVSMQFSYVEGYEAKALWGHGEWYLGGGASQGIGSILLSYMTFVGRWDQQQQSPTAIFPATNFPNTTGSFDIDHFVNINSTIGKASSTGSFQGCIGATFSGSTCSGAGNTLFMTSVTGTVGYGLAVGAYAVAGCNTSGDVYYLDTDTGSGTGYVDSWTLDSGNTPARILSVGPFNGCPSNSFTNQMAGSGLLSFSGAPIGTSTINNVYGDYASLNNYPTTPIISTTGLGGTQTVVGSVSGTTLTLSTSTGVITQSSVNAVGITGCSSGILGCPTITSPSGTGTVFTLSASGGTFGPGSIQLKQQNFCTAPTTFFDNIDMTAGLTNQNWPNQWSSDTDTINCH